MHRFRKLPPLLLAAALVVLGLAFTSSPALAQDPADAPAADAPAADAADADAAEGAPTDGEAAEGAPTDGEPTEGEGMEGEGDEAAPVDDATEDEGDDEEESGVPSPWSNGLILSMTALIVGGGSAVLGIWVDRDKTRPVSFAYAMSFLISCAIVVGCAQGYLDAVGAIQKEQDLERMLDMTYEIAVSSGDPELIALVEKEAGIEVEAAPPAPAEEDAADTGAPTEDAETDGEGTDGTDTEGDDAEGDDAPAGDASDEDILAGDDAPAGN